MIPAYIPSKGRPNATTPKLVGEDAVLVVEPQDAEAYRQAFPGHNMLVLEADNQGLAFSRNSILNHARKSGHKWIWMIDDDVKGFFRYEGTKALKVEWGEIAKFLEWFTENSQAEKAGQVALEYSQFAWSTGGKTKENGYCDVCVAINVQATKGLSYRPYVVLKEDRDFTLQVLARGYKTLRFTHFAFTAPKNGSNKGGLHDLYHQKNRELLAVNRMIELWGTDICKLQVKKDGRQDVKINWKHFSRI